MAPEGLILQRSLYIGNAFSGILYGVQLTLCFQSIHYLRQSRQVHRNLYIAFSVLLAFFNAIELAANSLYGEFVWIERGQETEGGPIAYFAENTAWWFNVFGTSSNAAADFMSQALLLYRLYIIMGGNWLVLILPGLMLLASTALAIVSTVQSALPNEFILSGQPANFGVPWVSISVSYNALVTIIIILRLLYAQKIMRGVASPAHSKTYTGIMAIMIESALPLTLVGVVFSVFYGKTSPTGIAFAGVWGALIGIAPQWIILRVSMGTGWTRETMITTGGGTNSVRFARSSQIMTKEDDLESGHGSEKLAATSAEQSISTNNQTLGASASALPETSYTKEE